MKAPWEHERRSIVLLPSVCEPHAILHKGNRRHATGGHRSREAALRGKSPRAASNPAVAAMSSIISRLAGGVDSLDPPTSPREIRMTRCMHATWMRTESLQSIWMFGKRCSQGATASRCSYMACRDETEISSRSGFSWTTRRGAAYLPPTPLEMPRCKL